MLGPVLAARTATAGWRTCTSTAFSAGLKARARGPAEQAGARSVTRSATSRSEEASREPRIVLLCAARWEWSFPYLRSVPHASPPWLYAAEGLRRMATSGLSRCVLKS